MTESYFAELGEYARAFAGLTPARDRLIHEVAGAVVPHLDRVTSSFYEQLQGVARAAPFLEGRLPSLRRTHRAWLETLFTAPYDTTFVERMYRVGDVHMRVGLPVEFMAGGMTMIADHLLPVLMAVANNNPARQEELVRAVTSALGYALIIMQESYQLSQLAGELDKFLAITGISRAQFNNLVAPHRKPTSVAM